MSKIENTPAPSASSLNPLPEKEASRPSPKRKAEAVARTPQRPPQRPPQRTPQSSPAVARSSKTLREREVRLATFIAGYEQETGVKASKQEINRMRILEHIKQKAAAGGDFNLTREEKGIITHYTSSALFSHAYREHLQGIPIDRQYNIKNPAIIKAKCKLLYEALSKLPHYKGIVFHGFVPPRKNPKRIAAGDYISNQSFLSSSVSKEFAVSYAIDSDSEGEDTIPDASERSVILVINSKTGKNIAAHAEEEHDAAEVLFQPDSTFFVEKKVEQPGINRTLIYVREQEPPPDTKLKDLFSGKEQLQPLFRPSLMP